MSLCFETCRKRKIRIPRQLRSGNQIMWEEMSGIYGNVEETRNVYRNLMGKLEG
jgi:hypothetical protein